MDHKKEFIKRMNAAASGRLHLWEVFSGFCEMAAMSYLNATLTALYGEAAKEREDWKDNEARYMRSVKRLGEDAVRGPLPEALGLVVEALEAAPHDFLGQVFQEMELSSHWKGQFFTPDPVSQLAAELTAVPSIEAAAKRGDFVTMNEPSCGAGAMVIAVVAACQRRQVPYQRHLHVIAQDVDQTAAYMAYVQLTLLHVPAVVVVGNTLSTEVRESLPTFAHVMGGWEAKLRFRDRREREAAVIEIPKPVEWEGRFEQVSLFDAA